MTNVTNLCTNGFMNCSQVIGEAVISSYHYTTGDLFLSLFFLMLFLLAVAMMFSIPIEYTMIIFLPLVLGCMSYLQEFVATGAIILIYLSIIITKNFMLR